MFGTYNGLILLVCFQNCVFLFCAINSYFMRNLSLLSSSEGHTNEWTLTKKGWGTRGIPIGLRL